MSARAARASWVLVVAVHAQPPRIAPRQIATTAAAMRAGRRRNFGGGGNGGSAEDGGGTCDRSYRVAVLLIFVCPLAAARYSTSTCASPTVISTDLCRPSRRMAPEDRKRTRLHSSH